MIDEKDDPPGLKAFMNDINHLTSREGSWCITLLAASGAQEPEYPTQFHFCYGGEKGDESYDGENLLIHDISVFDDMYQELSDALKAGFGFDSDRQRYHNSINPQIYIRHLECPENLNAFIVRIAWSVTCWDMRRIQVAKTLADTFSRHFNGAVPLYSEDLTTKGIGFDGYEEFRR